MLFGSTSKITFAGAGLAFLGGSPATLDSFRVRLSVLTIGPDKVNQLRHVKLLGGGDAFEQILLVLEVRRHGTGPAGGTERAPGGAV